MKLVVFGLSVSSSWGNGHATLWRGLIGALAAQGHRVVFFERDAPWYAQHRDIAPEVPGLDLVIYRDWREALPLARAHLADADVGMVTSYCHDGVAATHEVLASRARRAFYDLDAPVTLERVRAGVRVPWLGADGLRGFDIVLSYAGGATLDGLRRLLGARRAAPLYGSVDPAVHAPAPPREHLRADLSYLGTYAADRQAALDALLLACARRRPEQRFLIGGSQYPPDFPWGPNVHYVRHVPPADHGAFYSSSRLTLSVTRGPMAAVGWCPSGRLFEAAACGAAVLTDAWPGLEVFFRPGEEVLVARTTDEALAALDTPAHVLRRIGCAARERALRDHTAAARARELVDLLGAARDGRRGEAA
ncbi:MAG: glycosyltransferase [Planctomycetes bacterium]|nr:glycosyltransferase [Planctomycetota bacterium]